MALKILTVIGGRPQTAMALVGSLALAEFNKSRGVQEVSQDLLCLGPKKISLFFKGLEFPHLGEIVEIDEPRRGHSLSRFMALAGDFMEQKKPDLLIVYGDDNESLAAALAAAKRGAPILRVEAGLRVDAGGDPRAFNRDLLDKLATWRFCPNRRAFSYLQSIGLADNSVISGDFLFEALERLSPLIDHGAVLENFQLQEKNYILASLHQSENVDSMERLRNIAQALQELSAEKPVLWLGNPNMVEKLMWFSDSAALRLEEPVPYLDMLALQKGAAVVLTDSGAIQREAVYQEVPVVTVSDRTDWPETVLAGLNVLAGVNGRQIIQWARKPLAGPLSALDLEGAPKKCLLDFLVSNCKNNNYNS